VGRAAARAYYSWYRRRERTSAREARQREANYRRRGEGEEPGNAATKGTDASRELSGRGTDVPAAGDAGPKTEAAAPRYDWRRFLDPRRASSPQQD